MPASAGGLVPGAQRIVAQDYSLLADTHLRQVAEPNEPVLQFAHSSVVTALDEKDSLATNAIEVLLGVLRSSEAEIAKEVEDVPLLGSRVEPIEDGGIHFTYVPERRRHAETVGTLLRTRVVQGLRAAPLGDQLDSFVATLAEAGYSRTTVQIRLRLLAHLGMWLRRTRSGRQIHEGTKTLSCG